MAHAQKVAAPVSEAGKRTGQIEPPSAPDQAGLAGIASLEAHVAWGAISRLPVLLDVSIPVERLRVRDLFSVQPGRIIRTRWNSTADLPLSTGALRLAWGEFDILNDKIALRLTRLA